MLFKKTILMLGLLNICSGVNIFAQKDNILDAINNGNHEAITDIVDNYNLLNSNKRRYLSIINEKLANFRSQNNKTNKLNKIPFFNSLGYLGISVILVIASKNSLNQDNKLEGAFLAGSSGFLAYQGICEMAKAFNPNDMLNYYKNLAIKEEINRMNMIQH